MKGKRAAVATHKHPKSVVEPQDVTQRRQGSRLLVCLLGVGIAVVTILCFSNSLGYGFVFDDQGYVLGRPLLRSLSKLPKLLAESYRPLRNVSYAIDFAIWGGNPFGFHLTNLLIHASNVMLVFALARRFSLGLVSSCIGALIFAIHPMQVDSVTYISGRRDVLFALFYLASLHFYLASHRSAERRDDPKYGRMRGSVLYLAFFVSWVLSLMSKEMAASLPVVVFAMSFCAFWDPTEVSWKRRVVRAAGAALRKDRWFYALLLLAVPAYAFYAIGISGGSLRAQLGELNYWGGSFYTNVLTTARVHAWYLKQLVLPTPIVQYQGAFDASTTILDWRVIVALIVAPLTLISGFVLLSRNRLLAFLVISYFALLLPVSHIIPHHELLADHYLYLPLVSFGFAVGLGVEVLSKRSRNLSRVVMAGISACLVALAVMTFLRNRVYADDLTLWETNYREAPNSFRAAFNLGTQNVLRFPARAAQLYERSIELDPSFSPPYVALSGLYQSRESAHRLEGLIEKGLQLPDSRLVGPFHSTPTKFRSDLTGALGSAKAAQGEDEAAERLFVEAIHLNLENVQPYEPLAAYYRRVDHQKEIAILKQYAIVSPSRGRPLLALRLIEYGRPDDAITYLRQILADTPTDFLANLELSKIAASENDCAQARSYLTIAQGSASNAADRRAATDVMSRIERQCQ